MLTTLLKIPYLRFKYRFLPNKAQQFWAQELLNSQGLSAKIGQILGQGQTTELPKSTLSVDEAKSLFLSAFSKKIEIADEVLAASMGQVFFVKIDGEEYALKVLHPGIKQKLKGEIENILLLGGYFGKAKGFAFNKDVFKRFLVDVFEEETDLNREAQFQEKFYRIFENDPRFKVPQVNRTYSNDALLCQELVKSNLARDSKTFPNFDIFHFFLQSLLQEGILHGDLNDRNWGHGATGVTVVYDYGCTQIISGRRILGFKKLLMNIDVKEAFLEFGIRLESTWFKGKEQELRDALFRPLLAESLSPEWSYSEELQSLFGEKIKLLREFTDPWVLLMMRSLFSLIRIYQNRKISIPLGSIIAPYLLHKELPMKAKEIRIKVQEGEKEVVSMTFPLSALENLEELMPEKVNKKMVEENIDIQSIIQKVTTSDYAPQDLFKLNIDLRSYRVWIE